MADGVPQAAEHRHQRPAERRQPGRDRVDGSLRRRAGRGLSRTWPARRLAAAKADLATLQQGCRDAREQACVPNQLDAIVEQLQAAASAPAGARRRRGRAARRAQVLPGRAGRGRSGREARRVLPVGRERRRRPRGQLQTPIAFAQLARLRRGSLDVVQGSADRRSTSRPTTVDADAPDRWPPSRPWPPPGPASRTSSTGSPPPSAPTTCTRRPTCAAAYVSADGT